MIDFRIFSIQFLTLLGPRDGFTPILVEDIAREFYQKYFIKTSPRIFADPRPHDEEHAGPDQGELDEEGVEVGRGLRHNVAHQVNSPASEVVKLVWRGHLYIQDLINMLQKLQNHAL